MTTKSESKKQRILRRFKEWSELSTIAGYSNFYRTENGFIKALWLVSFIGAIGFCAYLSVLSVMEYLEYNVSTESRYLRESPMTLPGVMLCPSNSLRSSIGNQYALNYSHIKINSNITSVSQWTDYLSFGEIESNKYTALIDVPDNGSLYDLNYSQIFLNCLIGSQNCTDYKYEQFYDTYYGNCFNFNYDTKTPYQMNKVDFADGFRAIVYVGDSLASQHATFNTEDGRGLRLMVFNQTSIEEKHFTRLSPGFCHYIKLRKFVRNSLPAPYSTCEVEDSIDTSIYKKMKQKNNTYTQSLCMSWCMQEQIIKRCGCYYSWLLQVDSVTRKCDNRTDVGCADDEYYRISKNSSLLCPDECPRVCSSVSYDYMYSFDLFPGAFDIYTQYRDKIKRAFPEITDDKLTYNFVRENVVCVYVYFDTLEFSYSNETPSKTIVQLVSDLGGIAGLGIGFR